jgi:hypothetical protein
MPRVWAASPRLPEPAALDRLFRRNPQVTPPVDDSRARSGGDTTTFSVGRLAFTPQMIGLGLLEAIAESDLLARADPNDADHDGISGRTSLRFCSKLPAPFWKI